MTDFNQSKSKRGGARPGAGRKAGSATKKTRAIADRAAAEGITPLAVMLETMAALRDKGELLKAAAVAKDAAPYMHPRLSTTELKGVPAPIALPPISMAPEALAALIHKLNEEF